MKDIHALAKIILSILGIYMLIRLLPDLLGVIFVLLDSTDETHGTWYYFVFGLGWLLLWSFLILWIFIWKRKKLVRWVTKDIPGQTEENTPVSWIAFGYRLVSFLVGLIFLYRFFAGMNRATLIILRWTALDSGKVISDEVWQLLGLALLLLLGIYLLCGAPQFVRWQTAKTLAFCKQFAYADEEEKSE